MIIFSNFRKEKSQNYEKVICDISMTGGNEKLPATELWIQTDAEHGYILNEKVCDGYLVAAMTFGMYYGQDVRVCGHVSKKLYNNLMNYGQTILINHDPGLQRVRIDVDGFVTEEYFEKNRMIVGTAGSFGIDGLTTLYDRWLLEEDPDNKINTVFTFNSGINGSWDDPNTKKLFSDRLRVHKEGLQKLGIPLVVIDTNIHQFFPKMFVYATSCYLGRYFCILNLQGGVKRYYLPNGFTYNDVFEFGDVAAKILRRGAMDIGLSHEEPFFVPLLNTEHMELVLDGAQFRRTEKTERLCSWDFTYKYLNVCQPGRQLIGDFSRNCSKCPKCAYTMYCLETLGKLDDFADVFNVQDYKNNKFSYLCQMIEDKDINDMFYDALTFAEERGVKVPSRESVRKFYFYKWRLGDIDSYIATVDELFNKYRDNRIILWGTGLVGTKVLAAMDILGLKADAVVDVDKNKQGERMAGYLVQDYGDVKKDGDVILVCGAKIYDDVIKEAGASSTCVNVFEIEENKRLGPYMDAATQLLNKYKGNRIILWGTGMVGTKALEAMDRLGLKVDAVVDIDKNKQGQKLFGYSIQNYGDVKKDGDVILVCGVKIYDDVVKEVGEGGTCVNVFEIVDNRWK